MTRKKPRFWDKLRGGLSEVDKKIGTGQDINDYKIKQLEEQMDAGALDGINIPGFNNLIICANRTKKSGKAVR